MRTTGRRMAIGAGGLAAVLVAISIPLVLERGGGGDAAKGDLAAARARAQPPGDPYAILWGRTRVGQPEPSVLARWPKRPYQHYRDGLKEDCYEWEEQAAGPDKYLAAHLYNLCFKDGVLRLKTIF